MSSSRKEPLTDLMKSCALCCLPTLLPQVQPHPPLHQQPGSSDSPSLANGSTDNVVNK